jgi:hypothetical protein
VLRVNEKNEENQLSIDPKTGQTIDIYKRDRKKTPCRQPKLERKAEYQGRALLTLGAGEAGVGRRGVWGQVRLVEAASHRPHAQVQRLRTLRMPPGQIPSQHVVICEWQDESTCMSMCV